MRSLALLVALCCAGGGSCTGEPAEALAAAELVDGWRLGHGGGTVSGAGPAGSAFIPFTSDTESQHSAGDSSGGDHVSPR